MTEKSTKPQLRFAGFDDTWEQRKFEDVYALRHNDGIELESASSGDATLAKHTVFNAFSFFLMNRRSWLERIKRTLILWTPQIQP